MLHHFIDEIPLGTSFYKQRTLSDHLHKHIWFIKCYYVHAPHWSRGILKKFKASFTVVFRKPTNPSGKVLHLRLFTFFQMFSSFIHRWLGGWLDCPPSQDASGKWRFSLGSPTTNRLILVVTTQLDRGDNPTINHRKKHNNFKTSCQHPKETNTSSCPFFSIQRKQPNQKNPSQPK